MKNRIKEVRKAENLTQQAFADRLGIKQNTVASYEMGRIGISDAVVTSICREFSINENWLRTGEGEMKISKDEIFGDILADIITGDDDFIKDLVTAYMTLDKTSKDALKKLANNMIKLRKERN